MGSKIGAKRLKTLLKNGHYRWAPGNYTIPDEWRGRRMTALRRRRLQESIKMARVYLRTRKTMSKIAFDLVVTHQRAVQIVQRGVDFLLEKGRIRPADGSTPPAQSR